MDRPCEPGRFPACEAGLRSDCVGNSSVDFSVAVVLPAGGSGERTGLPTPKQFCTFLNRPLISYTIQAFERVPWIQSVIVVVAEESLGVMMNIIQRFHHRKVTVVRGGSTRHRSIFYGLRALDGETGSALGGETGSALGGETRSALGETTGSTLGGETDLALENGSAPVKPLVVIIHDAVRPFVEEAFLLKIAMAAREHGASGAVRPLVSTVIATTAEGYLDHSLERSRYRASEMPQGFLYDVIIQAYQKCSEWDFDFGTECLHLALQYCGTNARLLDGPPTLWKVTYKRDLAAADAIIKESLSRSACVLTQGWSPAADLAEALHTSLAALDMETAVFSDLSGDRARFLSQHWNFITVSANNACVSEVEGLVRALEESGRAVLHPPVIIWVHLNVSEGSAVGGKMGESEAMMEVSRGAKRRNMLLYGIQLHHSKDVDRWERSVAKLAEITSALIRDRNPAYTGQMMQV